MKHVVLLVMVYIIKVMINKCYKCMIDGYWECNNDETCNYCNSGYYKSKDNKYYKWIECYDCNNDGTFNYTCNIWYYKGIDNKCHECMIEGCKNCNNDEICNICKSGYYLGNDNGKYYECIWCSICNNDGTFKTYCNSEYYKGNDNRYYKCMFDGYNEYNDNDEICNTCNHESSLIVN